MNNVDTNGRLLEAELRRRKLAALRGDIDEGVADIEASRLVEPDVNDIMVRGRELLAARNPFA